MSDRGEALERVNRLIELEVDALEIEDARAFLDELLDDVDDIIYGFERRRRMKAKNLEEKET